VIAGAGDFYVDTGRGCGNSGADSPVLVALYPECVSALNTVLTAASGDGVLMGFGFAKNVAKPALNQTTNVGPLVFAAPGKTTVTAANLPPSTSTSAQLRAVVGGASFAFNPTSGALDDGGLGFATPTGFAEAYQTLVRSQSTTLGPSKMRALLRREATTAPALATLAFDLATALPGIASVTVTKATPARPDVAFTGDAPLTAADGAVAVLSWSIPAQEATGRWTFVVPPSTTAFQAPVLPADAGGFVPTADVALDSLTVVEATLLPGYKELKSLPVTPAFGMELSNENALLPAAGTVRISRWGGGRLQAGPTF
jgi:hypothetical protein